MNLDARAASLHAVIKRDGTMEAFEIEKLLENVMLTVDPRKTYEEQKSYASRRVLTQSHRVIVTAMTKMTSPVETKEISAIIAETAAEFEVIDLVYGGIAASTELQSIYKVTEDSFTEAMNKFSHLQNEDFKQTVKLYSKELNDMVKTDRDIYISYPAIKALLRTYITRDNETIYERPQYVFLRTAVQVHGTDMVAVKACYDDLSLFRFTFASPTIFNSGMRRPQLNSCYLLPAEEKADDIIETLSQVSTICRHGGGIGLGFQGYPAKGSIVDGIERNGIEPALKLFNSSVDVIDQSVKKRPCAMCIYVEPWHADIFSILRQKKVRRGGEDGARKLFYALWVPDLFMERVEQDGEWTLFCPSDVPGLVEEYDDAFEESYIRAEKASIGKRTVRARALWHAIIESQVESGGPSILFKDSINRKSNESHLGTITQGNLCTEIVQYADDQETAVCTLASIILPSFVTRNKIFNFKALEGVVRRVVHGLNRVIRTSWYPTPNAKNSARLHRAIGIGIQGLAETFALMDMAFDSDEAAALNVEIAEAIQYTAYDASADLTRDFGIYASFEDSPLSSGWLQSDRWNSPAYSGNYDWNVVRDKVKKGVANSLLTALMPTAGTSLLTSCTECFEPFPSLIFNRKVLAGQFTMVQRLLVERLSSIGLWTEDIRNRIIADGGSIQNIDVIPDEIKKAFKTVWDIDPGVLVKMAAARGPFICQSQSMSLYFKSPTISDVSKQIFLAWRMGLKTGLYYLRTQPAVNPTPITLPVSYWPSFKDEGSSDGQSCISCSG